MARQRRAVDPRIAADERLSHDLRRRCQQRPGRRQVRDSALARRRAITTRLKRGCRDPRSNILKDWKIFSTRKVDSDRSGASISAVNTPMKLTVRSIEERMMSRRSTKSYQFGKSLLAFCAIAHTLAAYGRDAAELCDKQILNNSGDSFGYRLRGDHCEGEYKQPTAASPLGLTIISFACTGTTFDLNGSSKPVLMWSAAANAPISIRADTLPEIRLRYRLDAEVSGPSARWTWNGDVWRALSISPDEIGIVIKGRPKLGSIDLPGTLLQARLGSGNSVPDCPMGPNIVIRADRKLTSVDVCAVPLLENGTVGSSPLCQRIAGPLAPNKGVSANLGVLRSPTGIMRLSLVGTSPGSAPSEPRFFRIKVD